MPTKASPLIGVSPRGTLLLQRATQARALLEGRDFVVPDDVKAIAIPVLSHRVIPRGPHESLSAETIIEDLLTEVAVPL